MSDELSGRELDAAIAKVCGWRDIGEADIVTGKPPSHLAGLGTIYDIVPRYSTDIAAAFTLGVESERLGIAPRYLGELADSMPDIEPNWEWDFALAHATAEQRARAFLRAWREARNEKR